MRSGAEGRPKDRANSEPVEARSALRADPPSCIRKSRNNSRKTPENRVSPVFFHASDAPGGGRICCMIRPEFRDLANLYWRLRACRAASRPSRSTWYRRIADEKKRLLEAGVDRFDLHAACVLLRRSEYSPAGQRALKHFGYLRTRERA